MAVVLLAAGGFLRWSKDGTGGRAHPVFEAIPFVADAAEADAPRISPSGTQIAYECTYGASQNICVRDAESGRVERLGKPDTRHEAPTWSPDGNTIAYLRFASPKPDQAEVIVRSPVSGPERVVAVVPETARGGSLKWSPDPRQLIISTTVAPNEALALFLLPIDTGGLKRLTTPLALSSRSSSRLSQYGDRSPAVSKDGKWLAFCRVNAEGLSSLYVVGLDSHLSPTGEPRRLETGQPYNVTPVWTPDGRELVFVSGVYRSRRLMRMRVFEPAQPEPILPQAGIVAFPEIGRDPRGKQILLFASATSISTLWEQPMRSGQASPEQIIPTAADDREPSYAPDATRIVFVADCSGYDEIWVTGRRQANPVQWTNMRCSQVSFPHRSRDSSRITFSSVCGGQEDIYVVDGPGLKPRRLTDTLQTNENSRWFPDGGWIYFTSVRSGVSSTWKVPEAGGTAAPVNSRLSSDPRISADGHTLYFIRLSDSKLNLMATPADHPGDDQLLVPEVSHYALGRSGIYFVTAKPGDATAHFRDSSTGKISVATRTERWLRGGFDLSADETRLIYARPDVFSVRLMKIDGFQ